MTLGEAAYHVDVTLSAFSLAKGALLCLVFAGNIPVLVMVIRSRTMKAAARWTIGNLAVRDLVFGLAMVLR